MHYHSPHVNSTRGFFFSETKNYTSLKDMNVCEGVVGGGGRKRELRIEKEEKHKRNTRVRRTEAPTEGEQTLT